MPTPDEAGTGGGLRYLTEEPSPDIFNQELPHSCQVACARQLLKDAGLTFTEEFLVEEIGYLEGWGTTAEDTARVLDELHPDLGYRGGPLLPEAITILFSRDPWIASMKTDSGRIHAVIVDKLENGIVYVRDPWGLFGLGSGTGTIATLLLDDFMLHWNLAFRHSVFPNYLKGV